MSYADEEKDIKFQIFGPGQVFGEAFLLPLGASTCQKISAETIVRAYTIDLNFLRDILDEYPLCKRALWESFSRTSVSHVLSQVSTFKSKTDVELELLLAQSHLLYFDEDADPMDRSILAARNTIGMMFQGKLTIPKSHDLVIVIAWGSVNVSNVTTPANVITSKTMSMKKAFRKGGRLPSLAEMDELASSNREMLSGEGTAVSRVPSHSNDFILDMHDHVVCTTDNGAYSIEPLEFPTAVCVFLGSARRGLTGVQRLISGKSMSFRKRQRRSSLS